MTSEEEMQESRGGGDGRKGSHVKRVRESRRAHFSSGELHREFESHVTAAQNRFLQGDSAAAEREATMALRIRPTAHLFAFLAVIAESKGMFDRASDFRLLQAFLSRDIVLWEQLLHEFMSQQLYFKSVVCLQRMSALEKDKERYRALQLQLADLLIGLGEVRRASNVLVPLWNSSRCRDFEVFAQLASLYFQLGKWASLQRLIESSIKHAFQPTTGATAAEIFPSTQDGTAATTTSSSAVASVGEEKSSPVDAPSTASARVSKRVRFFGVGDDPDDDVAARGKAGFSSLPGAGIAVPSPLTTATLDEFSFDDMLSPSSSPGPTQLPYSTDGAAGRSAPMHGGVIHQLYGERIELAGEQSKKNFLILVNVHAELLNEQGSFAETVQLLQMAAGCLEVDVMELPPDLMVRLGVAYAFLGGVWEQPCRDVFQHLVETCSMEAYGDVLLDAAVSLQKVGMHTEAAQLYTSLSRYHQFVYDRLHRQLGVQEMEVALMQDAASAEQLQAASDSLQALRAEANDVKTVLAAASLGEAHCAYAQELYDEARQHAERVLELEPTHLQARLLLGRYFLYQRNDTAAAVEVLTPRESEPALQRIQLGAFLVQVFQSAKRYVEAIALGVSLFEKVLSSEEDGDTQSVAPGTSSRRSSTSLYLPTMTRASSAIIPAASLAGMVRGAGGGSVTSRTSFSLAASIRASSSVARQQLSRRGLESLTTTVYGASAAASIAAGWDKKEAEERLKDSSTIFRFNRKRRRAATGADAAGDGDAGEQGEAEQEEVPQTAEQRRAAVLAMAPSAFWSEGEKEEAGEGEATEPSSKKVKAEGEEAVESAAVKQQPADTADGGAESSSPPAPESSRVCKDEKSGNLTAKASKPKRATGSRASKKSKKDEANDGGCAVPSSNTTFNEKERDLAELETFLSQAEEIAEATEEKTAFEEGGESGEAVLDSFDLPSLEEVSTQFDDPVMAQLFLEASSFAPGGGVRGGEGRSGTDDPWAALAEANDNNASGAGPLPNGTSLDDKVTLREAMEALGKVGFVALAVAVVDCYSAVGKFTEAREFAFVALTQFQQKRRLRQVGNQLQRPLRIAILRAALAAGESEDAFRVGLRLLQGDTTDDKRHEVVELMHGVLNRCEDRSQLLYRAVADGHGEPAFLVLLANRYFQARSYTRTLNLYLMALQQRPSDIYLNFMVGLSYLFCSHQKRTRLREACVSAAIYYLSQYQQLRLSLEPSAAAGEVFYNLARALQFLRLSYLSIPLYERVAYDLRAPTECTVALQRAARLNLYFIYRWGSGNRTLALSALQPRGACVESAPATRSPSPFAQ